MTITLGAIQGWGAQVGPTVSSAATSLEAAAPEGAFAHVLSQVSSTLSAGPGTSATSGSDDSTVTTGGVLDGDVSGGEVASEAKTFLGAPYVWGGESPTGFDCSGLVQYVYGRLGVALPRTSSEQALAGSPVASPSQAEPGDLVFFAGSDGTPTSPGHVGIYVGGGMMIDAPHTGSDVQIQPVGAAGTVVAIRRIVSTSTPFESKSTGLLSLGLSPTGLGSTGLTGAGLAAFSGTASTTGASVGVPANLAPLFVQAAGKYGVPASLLTAVARRESNFDTSAVSTAGAEGLMQIMPQTAAGLGVTPYTARQAINGAAQMLSGYLHAFGSVPLALAAYNAGGHAVEQYGGIPPYSQTETYVRDIMATLEATG